MQIQVASQLCLGQVQRARSQHSEDGPEHGGSRREAAPAGQGHGLQLTEWLAFQGAKSRSSGLGLARAAGQF